MKAAGFPPTTAATLGGNTAYPALTSDGRVEVLSDQMDAAALENRRCINPEQWHQRSWPSWQN